MHTIGQEITNQQIVALDIQHTPVFRTWYLVTPNKREASTAAEAFLQFMLEKAGGGILNDLFVVLNHTKLNDVKPDDLN